MMQEDQLKYELERLRHEYEVMISTIKQDLYQELVKLQAQLVNIQRDQQRKQEQVDRQNDQINALLQLGKKMEQYRQQAITADHIRHWLLGIASLLGMLLFVFSIVDHYHHSHMFTNQERRKAAVVRRY